MNVALASFAGKPAPAGMVANDMLAGRGAARIPDG